jgi:hypothetical protein
MIRTLMSAAGRRVVEALIIAGSASCAHLIVSAQAEPEPAATGGPLTPDEQSAWADLVTRLAA